MAASAAVAARLGARGIDLNFGCPAKRVNDHDGGASILRCPQRAELITRAVRDAVPCGVPVSVKIRLGWADAEAVVELAQRIERGGATWLTIHGRTKAQMYVPPVDYAAIGRARRSVRIPVVANGDLASPADVARCTALSGIDSAFMLGRPSLARPWLFRTLRGQAAPGLHGELPQVLLRYARIIERAGCTPDHALRRLKQWLSLAMRSAPEVRPLFEIVKVQSRLRDAQHALGRQADLVSLRCGASTHPMRAPGPCG
jgi:tRNA-dihydrouridine synthase C